MQKGTPQKHGTGTVCLWFLNNFTEVSKTFHAGTVRHNELFQINFQVLGENFIMIIRKHFLKRY
jgi:hypothetical protein